MRFDGEVELAFADGKEIRVKVSELVKLAFAGASFDLPWRFYVNKHLVAETKSWDAEPNPDEIVEVAPEPAPPPVPSSTPAIRYKDD